MEFDYEQLTERPPQQLNVMCQKILTKLTLTNVLNGLNVLFKENEDMQFPGGLIIIQKNSEYEVLLDNITLLRSTNVEDILVTFVLVSRILNISHQKATKTLQKLLKF